MPGLRCIFQWPFPAAMLIAFTAYTADAPNDSNDGAQPDSPPPAAEGKTKKGAAAKETVFEKLPPTDPALLKDVSGVRVEILATLLDDSEHFVTVLEPYDAWVTDTYSEPAMAFVCVPTKYDDKAQRADRGSPFLVRATTTLALPPGESKILLRAFNASRLLIDGKEVASSPALKAGASGHNPVPADPKKLDANIRALRAGHNERLVTLNGGTHTLVLIAQIAGGKLRPEVG